MDDRHAYPKVSPHWIGHFTASSGIVIYRSSRRIGVLFVPGQYPETRLRRTHLLVKRGTP